MAYRFISYGKKLENLKASIQHNIIGSEFSTFQDKVKNGDQVFLVCNSKVWGEARVVGDVEFDQENRIWNDKIYPYRARITDVSILRVPFKLDQYDFNAEFRQSFGKGWAFKVLFTPELSNSKISLGSNTFFCLTISFSKLLPIIDINAPGTPCPVQSTTAKKCKNFDCSFSTEAYQ